MRIAWDRLETSKERPRTLKIRAETRSKERGKKENRNKNISLWEKGSGAAQAVIHREQRLKIYRKLPAIYILSLCPLPGYILTHNWYVNVMYYTIRYWYIWRVCVVTLVILEKMNSSKCGYYKEGRGVENYIGRMRLKKSWRRTITIGDVAGRDLTSSRIKICSHQ